MSRSFSTPLPARYCRRGALEKKGKERKTGAFSFPARGRKGPGRKKTAGEGEKEAAALRLSLGVFRPGEEKGGKGRGEEGYGGDFINSSGFSEPGSIGHGGGEKREKMEREREREKFGRVTNTIRNPILGSLKPEEEKEEKEGREE